MATLSEAQAVGLVTLAMILSGAVVISSISQSYYCQPEDNVKECIKLSSTGITCYTISGSDRCTNGKWLPLVNYINQNPSSPRDYFFIRDPDGKICYEYGDLRKGILCSEAEKRA